MPAQSLFYVSHGADGLKRLESALTSARRRCNLMHVKSAEQAAAIIRRDAAARAPDLVLIWGGATDTRAGALARMIQADALLGGSRFVVIADDAEAHEAEKLLQAGTLPLPDDELRRLIDADGEFWWVVVRFAA